MKRLETAEASNFSDVRFVLTDMDETLTYEGRLSARTYEALERLEAAGIQTIPVTAAPAGWCDQMARMWPVAGVIAENGGLFIRRRGPRAVERRYWHSDMERTSLANRLSQIVQQVQTEVPAARLADDQSFRLTSIAFARPKGEEDALSLIDALRNQGASATVNNLWVLGWLGEYDKLAMTRRIMAEVYDIDIDKERHAIFYSGDSLNDAPMFEFFEHTVGVSTIADCLEELRVLPAWITRGAGGEGFVEAAEAILRAKV